MSVPFTASPMAFSACSASSPENRACAVAHSLPSERTILAVVKMLRPSNALDPGGHSVRTLEPYRSFELRRCFGRDGEPLSEGDGRPGHGLVEDR